MYLNFEAFKGIEKIEKIEKILVFPNPMGILNQKNLWPTLIYQFEHLGHPMVLGAFRCILMQMRTK